MKSKIAIIGAGLTLARSLNKKADVVVYEKSRGVGSSQPLILPWQHLKPASGPIKLITVNSNNPGRPTGFSIVIYGDSDCCGDGTVDSAFQSDSFVSKKLIGSL